MAELLGGGKLDILLDTEASKCYMLKAYYMCHPHLHHFPKFQSAIRYLQVGNGALVPALFIIPLLFKSSRTQFGSIYPCIRNTGQNRSYTWH